MPRRPPITCNHPGCTTQAVKNGYCERHRKSGWQRDKARQSMYNHKWERASKAFLSEHPWCHDCGGVAVEVHHVHKHQGDTSLFWDENNWMGLCHSCHSARTRRGE